jgi:cytochrome c biogenesis protein ResB
MYSLFFFSKNHNTAIYTQNRAGNIVVHTGLFIINVSNIIGGYALCFRCGATPTRNI